LAFFLSFLSKSVKKNQPDPELFESRIRIQNSLKSSVAEPHHFYAAPAPGENFDAAPAPTLLYSKAKFLK
jgi:hypothetical protein